GGIATFAVSNFSPQNFSSFVSATATAHRLNHRRQKLKPSSSSSINHKPPQQPRTGVSLHRRNRQHKTTLPSPSAPSRFDNRLQKSPALTTMSNQIRKHDGLSKKEEKR
ncbi:hypothetical protein M8C21_021259, partial [Ambrosia artemisiifolia]